MMRLMVCTAELVCRVGEDQVARFGDGKGRLHRFQVADFADQHDIRVLAQDVFQGLGEAGRIGAHFALVDERILMRVQIFDGVFDGDDVGVALGVHQVDHRGQGGGFTRTRGAGDEDQAARTARQVGHHFRQAQLREAHDAEGNRTESPGDGPALHEDVGAETRKPFHPEGQVQLVAGLELGLLAFRQDRIAELLGVGGGERGAFDRHQTAVDTQLRGRAGGDVQIARTAFDHRLEQLVQGQGRIIAHRLPFLDQGNGRPSAARAGSRSVFPGGFNGAPTGRLVGRRVADHFINRRHAVIQLVESGHAQGLHAEADGLALQLDGGGAV